MKNIYVALENVRSLYNVGALIRTCSFYGVNKVVLVGYSGKLKLPGGKTELHDKIKKTALESEKDLEIIFIETSQDLLNLAKQNKLKLVCIEQDNKSTKLANWNPQENSLIVLGNEVDGVSKELLNQADETVEILKPGFHNSLNVTTTAGIVINKISETLTKD